MKRPALFLDRDGVINIDYGYVHKIDEFDFIEGIFDLVKKANSAGYLVVIVTNQAGIGRGYYSEDDFHYLMDWVKLQFKNHDAKIDKVYFCSTHPVHGIGKYKKESKFRKPNSGMILKAAQELKIDLSQSILIGDNMSDIEAGKTAKIPNLHLISENCQIKVLSEKEIFSQTNQTKRE